MATALQGIPAGSWLLFVDEAGPKHVGHRLEDPLIHAGVLVPATAINDIENSLWHIKGQLFPDLDPAEVTLHARQVFDNRNPVVRIQGHEYPVGSAKIGLFVNSFLTVLQRPDCILLLSRCQPDAAKAKALEIIDRLPELMAKHGLDPTEDSLLTVPNMDLRLHFMAVFLGFQNMLQHATALLVGQADELIIVADRLEGPDAEGRERSMHRLLEHWLYNLLLGKHGSRLALLQRPPHYFASREMNLLQVADLAAFIGRNMLDYNDSLRMGALLRPALGRNGLQGRASGLPGVLTYPPLE